MPSTPLRIALVCTPRSGNNWLRLLLGAALELPTLAVHEITEEQLAELPPECIFAIHARRDPDFVAMLNQHGFRLLTISRHPCDVLVSILQFAVHESESGRWLNYRGGDETGILGTTPRSRSFAEYACGERAKQLFGVTADWWDDPDTVTVRYEELVKNPIAELERLVAEFRPSMTPNLEEIVNRYSLQERRLNTFHNQIWKGTPGHWRAYITAEIAQEIAAAHTDLFLKLEYECDPDPDLTDSQADRNWVEAVGPGLRAALSRSQTSHTLERLTLHSTIETARLENNALTATVETLRAELNDHSTSRERLRQESLALAATVETLRAELNSQTERVKSHQLENHALSTELKTVQVELDSQTERFKIQQLEHHAIATTVETLRTELNIQTESVKSHQLQNVALTTVLETLRTELHIREQMVKSQQFENGILATTVETVRTELHTQIALVEKGRVELDLAQIATRTVEREVAECRDRLMPFEGLQRFSIRVARGIQSVRNRMPKWLGSKR